MKTASPALIAILNSSTTDYLMADIWKITLKNGTILKYTNADINLTVGSDTYIANDVHVDGGKINWETGLEVGEDDITMYPNQGLTPSLVGLIPYNIAVPGGLFDRASVIRSRLFMTTWGVTTPGAVILFVGEMTNAKISQNIVTASSKDLRNLLNVFMPSRQYQPTCPFVFGDANCGFDRSTIAVNSSVTSISGSLINCNLAQAAGFFNNGIIKFTSGKNNGQFRSVKSWIPGTIQIVAPFPVTPQPGDTFTITPGCTKNFSGATSAFAATAQSGSTQNVINTALTNASGFFNGGTLQFTSGLNVGQVQTINSWSNGVATLAGSFSNVPALGDECELTAISTNITNSCSDHFGGNAPLHFGGQRFLPVPETSY